MRMKKFGVLVKTAAGEEIAISPNIVAAQRSGTASGMRRMEKVCLKCVLEASDSAVALVVPFLDVLRHLARVRFGATLFSK